MVQVYNAETTADADLIKGLLAQQGVQAYISDHCLQGAFGELPVVNLIQVMVDSDHEQQARQILQDYQAGKYQIDDQNSN